MIDEDPTPHRQPVLARPVLDTWGVAELRAYIEALREEIARAESAIGARSHHRAAAEAVFGRKP